MRHSPLTGGIRSMRWLVALLVVATSPLAPTAARASHEVVASAVVVLYDEEGAGVLEALCTAQASATADIVATRVRCWTRHSSARQSAPGPVATTRLRATEGGRAYQVCVDAEAYYEDGTLLVDGPRCFLPDLIVARDGDGCRVYAEPPASSHNFSQEARGGIACHPERSGLRAQVCLEALDASAWTPVSCADHAQPGPATQVEATAYGCRYGAWLTRTVTIGTLNGTVVDRAESEPVAYYCTPLTRRR